MLAYPLATIFLFCNLWGLLIIGPLKADYLIILDVALFAFIRVLNIFSLYYFIVLSSYWVSRSLIILTTFSSDISCCVSSKILLKKLRDFRITVSVRKYPGVSPCWLYFIRSSNNLSIYLIFDKICLRRGYIVF